MVTDLVETSLDITTVYGLDEVPPLDQIPTYTVDFSKTYGFKDYSAESIDSFYTTSDLETYLQLMSDKIGFPASDP